MQAPHPPEAAAPKTSIAILTVSVATVVALLVLVAVVPDGSVEAVAQPRTDDAAELANSRDVAGDGSDQAHDGGPVRIVWVGDMMLGSTTPTPRLPGNGAKNTFNGVKDLLDADVVTGNLEGPITDEGPKDKCSDGDECYMFSQPPGYEAVYKAAGFDILNLANNHSYDRGEQGRAETMKLLDGAGISYTGLPDQVVRKEIGGTSVAFVGFSHYRGTNPITDHDEVARQVHELDASADIVVVFFHGGLEGDQGTHISHTGDPGTDFIGFAHTAVQAGADLVVGSGPRVLRAMEIYQDRLIAYSLGNFATYGWFGLTKTTSTSAVLAVTLAPDGRFSEAKLSPTKLAGKGTPAKGGDAVALVSSLSDKDFPETGVSVSSDGAITRRTPGKA